MELEVGTKVQVNIEDGGRFYAKVEEFQRGGNVAVLMPTRNCVRDVFPKGYRLGRAHWDSHLVVVD